MSLISKLALPSTTTSKLEVGAAAGPVVLSEELAQQLRASLPSPARGTPTTALHQRIQAFIDTTDRGSAKVAEAVSISGAKVEGLGTRIGDIAVELGSAARVGQRLDDLDQRLKKVELRDSTPVGGQTPTESGIPPAAPLSDAQVTCLRAITQIDAQLLDKQVTSEELTKHLHKKFTDRLGQEALAVFELIAEGETWKSLCAPVQTLQEVPARILKSLRLRNTVIQRPDLQDSAAKTA
jgi:hypothetical protein